MLVCYLLVKYECTTIALEPYLWHAMNGNTHKTIDVWSIHMYSLQRFWCVAREFMYQVPSFSLCNIEQLGTRLEIGKTTKCLPLKMVSALLLLRSDSGDVVPMISETFKLSNY